MKSPKIYLFLAIIAVVFLIGLIFSMRNNHGEKFAVVDKKKLFSEFKMTKEISNQISISNNALKVKYEDLMKAYSSANNESERVYLGQQLEVLQNEIEKLNGPYRDEQTEIIWRRIQAYSEVYSSDENYIFILGFENNGDVIGFKKENDITEKLLQYLNKRYEGIN